MMMVVRVQSLWWIGLVVCFLLVNREAVGDDFSENKAGKKPASCEQVCQGFAGVDVKKACQYAPDGTDREEVVVVTNGDSVPGTWQWDSISMVVSEYFSSIPRTAQAACWAHAHGKRYGLRQVIDADKEQPDLINNLKAYQDLLKVDHMVFDLLDAMRDYKRSNETDKSDMLSKLKDTLTAAVNAVKEAKHNREVYCIVPWEPPCDADCTEIMGVLGLCEVLLLSPDSYNPVPPSSGECMAGATVPITKFLYGMERYFSMHLHPISMVAGIPWHGFEYTCKELKGNKCMVNKASETECFDDKNRKRQSLAEIHSKDIADKDVNLDLLGQAVFYNEADEHTQLWYENFTTLYIKYQLVKDLKLRGLSIWYGEDMAMGATADKSSFSFHSWDFLTHHILHKAVYKPIEHSTYYANTVAGIGVGCLILGTALGVTFTCIGFRRNSYRLRNRPFKLDEDEDAFRDDEGL